jgi:hypothetical protein
MGEEVSDRAGSGLRDESEVRIPTISAPSDDQEQQRTGSIQRQEAKGRLSSSRRATALHRPRQRFRDLMSGTILPFHPTEHATADALLPWYVNGTLRGEELELVTRHLAACEQCRKSRSLRDASTRASPCPRSGHAAAALQRGPRRQVVRSGSGNANRRWLATAQPWMRGLMAAHFRRARRARRDGRHETRDNPAIKR